MTPPPAYKTILVKLKKPDNTTVREAVEVRDILADSMFKGDHAILYLAGLANDSLVFYVAEGNVGPMIQRMQCERDKMLASRMGYICQARQTRCIANGDISSDSNVKQQLSSDTVRSYKCYCSTYKSGCST